MLIHLSIFTMINNSIFVYSSHSLGNLITSLVLFFFVFCTVQPHIILKLDYFGKYENIEVWFLINLVKQPMFFLKVKPHVNWIILENM